MKSEKSPLLDQDNPETRVTFHGVSHTYPVFKAERSPEIASFLKVAVSSFARPFYVILLTFVPVLASEILSASSRMWIFPVAGCALASYNATKDESLIPPPEDFKWETCMENITVDAHPISPFRACLHGNTNLDVRTLPDLGFKSPQNTKAWAVSLFLFAGLITLFAFYFILIRKLFNLRERVFTLLEYRVYLSVNRRNFYYMLLCGTVAALSYAAVKVYMISIFSGQRLSPTCSFYSNETDANSVSVWVKVGHEQVGWFKFAFDWAIALTAFLSPLMTIYFMIFNFYQDISVRELLRRPDATLFRILSSLYYVKSDDLERELHQIVGRKKDGSLLHYKADDFGAILPILHEKGEVIPMAVAMDEPTNLNSGDLSRFIFKK